MENNGWIKLHRSIMDTPDWMSEPFTKAQAWVDLLLLANRKTGFIRRRGIMVAVERGQVGYSVESLSSRWKWSKCKALRFLLALTTDERITRETSGNAGLSRHPKLDQSRIEKTIPKKTSVSSLITITNYERYQSNDTENDTEKRPKTIPEQEGKEIKPFLSNSDEVRLSEFLFEKILFRNSKHKKPNLQTWAKDVDRMIRLDRRTPEEIRAVIEWCQADTFWQNNILSAAKLREKFDQLQLKRGEVKKSTW